MNSMLRQSHIRSVDLRNFVRNYDASNTTAVSVWAKNASAGLELGSLVFIVEPVTLPFGLISFSRKEEEENFRVTDFAVVVRTEDNKPMVVNLNSNTYELRFLEALLEEKAKKSIIDRKRFTFVAAKPSAELPLSKTQELERLSNAYAKGGSRRTFLTGNAQDEPAIALLAACGARLQFTSVNKQPIDLGAIGHGLFNTDLKLPDSYRSQLRDNFIALPGDSAEAKTNVTAEAGFDTKGRHIDLLFEKPAGQSENGQEKAGFNLLQTWGEGSESRARGTALAGSASGNNPSEAEKKVNANKDFSSEIPKINKKESAKPSGSAANKSDNSVSAAIEYSVANLKEESAAINNIDSKDKIAAEEANKPDNTGAEAEDVFKHLSEAITDLLGAPSKPDEAVNVETSALPKDLEQENKKTKVEKDKWPPAKSFDKLRAIQNPRRSMQDSPAMKLAALSDQVTEKSISEPNIPENAATIAEDTAIHTNSIESHSLEQIVPDQIPSDISAISIQTPTPSDLGEPDVTDAVTKETGEGNILLDETTFISSTGELEDSDVITGDPVAIFSSADLIPSKLDDFQEPKVVMNEMASLMSKLESQVARAAKKLAVRASEVEKRLSSEIDTLFALIAQEDKDGYAELVVRIDVLSKQFESLFDTLKTELAEKAANSRDQVKAKLTSYQEKIDETENEQRENLIQEFKQNKTQFEQLVSEQEAELDKLIDEQTKVLDERINAVDQLLEDASGNLDARLEVQFAAFKERAEDNVLTLLKTFEHQLDTLNKDIERSCGEGIDKLNLVKNEFFSKLERLVQITEIDLSRQVRKAQTEAFLPRLKERKQIVEAMMHEMMQTFAEHSFSQAKAQSEGAEHSLVLARQQLKELVDERLVKLDLVGRNQQTGLEEIFRSAADPLEQNTATVVQLIKQAEQEINECEAICTKLAQSYNLDGDPKLTSLRQDVYSKVDSLKSQLRTNLESGLDDNCLKLENTTKNHHVKLNTKRAELVQQVRSASDKGLLSIRQAIHDAFYTVQSEREKHME